MIDKLLLNRLSAFNLRGNSLVSRLTISNPLLLFLALITILIGNVLLDNNAGIINILFIITAHFLILFSILTTSRRHQDWLSPINVILIIGLARFSLPLFLLYFGTPDIEIFEKMQVGLGENWRHANILAMIGLIGVTAGWYISFKRTDKDKTSSYHLDTNVAIISLFGMMLGVISLMLFISSNSSLSQAIISGSFRGTDIQGGTGIFFHLGLILISSSVILTAYLLRNRNVSYLVALLPVIFAMACYFVLGGRTRAVTPVVAGLVIAWYERERATFTLKNSLALFFFFMLLVMFYSGMVLYRARLGLEGFFQGISISVLMEYISTAIWVEVGQLHTLAGALLVGPGVLGGATFTKLFWPVSEFLDIPGNSTGIFLAETLVGFHNDKRWGLHATLIGDAYVNFGAIGLFIVTALFGVILKWIYIGYREKRINSAIYALFFIYSVRIFYESIEKYSELLTVMTYAIGLFVLTNLMKSIARE